MTYAPAQRSVQTVLNLLLVGALTNVSGVAAQTPPDAGSLLREQAKPPLVMPTQLLPLAPVFPAASQQDTGPKILVRGFRITGAILISETELTALLQGAVGQQLSLTQLQGAAAALVGYYAQRGYLARVIVPAQDVQDGIVKLQIIEGKRGSLRIDAKGERIDSARVQRFIDGRLASGDAMNLTKLGEALNILNEQPGIAVTSALVPGKVEADTDLVVTASAKPLVSTKLGVNNHSSRGTGEGQASAEIGLANPTGNLDAAVLNVTRTRGTTFGNAEYSIAVGDSGLRLGVNASHLRYHLTQAAFSALGSRGTARTVGVAANYPLARQSDFNLSLSGSFGEKRLIDQAFAGETGNRRDSVANVGLNGYFMAAPGNMLAGGITSFGASLSTGAIDQDNPGALAGDALTRQVQGHFRKISYNAGYLAELGATSSLNLALRGQLANKNLSSSERFSLGGPTAIRAYPVGEATGDEGWLISLSVTHNYNDALAVNAFIDAGGITVNRDLWPAWNAANPLARNRYSLSGLGVGVDWRIGPALLSASIAKPLGKNPGRDANDNNSDGSSQHHARGWLSLTAQF